MRALSFPSTALCGLALAAAGAAWWLVASHAHAADEHKEAASPVLRHVGAQLVVPEHSSLRETLVVQSADEQSIEVPLSLPAVVEADPSRLVKVSPPAAGRIASLDKGLGDPVRVGDLLFRIDSADLAQARSDAQKARSAQSLALQTLERQRALGSSGIAATREIEQAGDAVAQAQSDLTRANTRLAQLDADGKAAGSGRMLAVRSPVAGRVIELGAAQGAFWNDTTTPLLTVADLSKVFVTASAGESELRSLFPGQAVSVVLDAFPGETLHGTVRFIGEVLDPDTRRVKVRMLFDNHDGRLKPGMFANATFLSKPHRGLLVPMAAVVQSGLNSRVFVETSPWQFEPRVVRLGPKVGDSIELAGGIQSGERIVVHDGVLLGD